MADYTDKLPAPFDGFCPTHELPLRGLAHQVRALAVAAYGPDVDYQASAAWQHLCAALAEHRRVWREFGKSNDEHQLFRERMSDALGLTREVDTGGPRHEHDHDELVAAAEGYREDAEAAEQERAEEAWRVDD